MTSSTSISNVDKETEIVKTQKNTRNKSLVMIVKNADNENPDRKLYVETIVKPEIPDFEIETTSTSIQYVAKETTEKYNVADESAINIITHGSTQNKSPVMSLLCTDNRNPNFELKEEGEIKTEITDFEIETTPTTIQYVAKETTKFSPEKYNVVDETEINILVHGSTLNKSPVMSLLCTENRNPNFEVTVEVEEIKTEIPDFEFKTTPTSIQYVAKETGKLSTEEQLIEFENRSEKYLKRPYKCETCFIGFFSQKNYDEHLRCHTVSRANGPACSMCDVEFATEQGFILHCRITHDELKPVTEAIITSVVDLKNSKGPLEAPPQEDNKHNSVKRSEVKPVTEEMITSVEELKDSEGPLEAPPQEDNKHNSEGEQANIKKSNKCNICNKIFRDINYLKVHERVHTGLKPFECNTCDKRFTQMGHLKRHEIEHTGHKPYECNICNKKFSQKGDLKRHEKVHTGHKLYECNTCDKRFTQMSDLKRHEIVHTGHKPYECNTCDKKFTQIGALKRHERVHAKDKPYECNICDKKFTLSSDLKRHERVHTGLKPYDCNICDKKFALLGGLTRHERVHTGLKPYECNICDKKFTQMGYLKRHKLVHTGHKPYVCNVCDKKFRHKHHLKRHECSYLPLISSA